MGIATVAEVISIFVRSLTVTLSALNNSAAISTGVHSRPAMVITILSSRIVFTDEKYSHDSLNSIFLSQASRPVYTSPVFLSIATTDGIGRPSSSPYKNSSGVCPITIYPTVALLVVPKSIPK